ncbi:MAG: hypothetical protein JNK21_13925 [Rhodospirillaceae bacterium]|nr:hypothetical protein [Rhodospirillaceae bacterium]
MSLIKKIVSGVAFAAAMVMGVSAAQAQGAEFDGTTFSCLQYTSASSENSSTKAQSGLAKLWVNGYLAGYFKAKGTLSISEDAKAGDAIASTLAAKCKEQPGAPVWVIARDALGAEDRKLPKNAESIDISAYTCAAHVDAKAGSASDMMKADLADLWAFAFIQGFKNFTDKDMAINMENKPMLTGAVARNCGKMRDKTFLDLTAMVAQAVKLGGS